MQLSDDCEKLAWHQTGVKELVIKSLLPVISIIGPEAIALFSPMTPDKEEIKEGLLSFIPQEFLPEILYHKRILVLYARWNYKVMFRLFK